MSLPAFSPSKNWRERGYRKPGRVRNYAVRVIMNRFGVTKKQVLQAGVQNIAHCADNAAIRVLLGIGKKAVRGETWPVPDLHLASWRKHLERVA